MAFAGAVSARKQLLAQASYKATAKLTLAQQLEQVGKRGNFLQVALF